MHDNTIKSCEFINNRHKFMEYFVDNFYEFSDIRQSKYSSFMMIYELYKVHGICKVCLQLNVLNDVTVVGLKCQSCRDKKLKSTTSIHNVLINNSMDDQLMLEYDSNNNNLDENNPFHSIDMADVVSFSPIVLIERLNQEFIESYIRKSKIKQLSKQSKAIKKKSSLKNINSNIGNNLLKPLINYVNK